MATFMPKPDELGSLHPDVFETLHAEYPGHTAYIELRNGILRDPNEISARLLEITRPLYERYVRKFGRNGPAVIAIDTCDVQPGKIQSNRTGRWHTDRSPGLSAYDALPTEFLVDSRQQPLSQDQKELRSLITTELKSGRITMDDTTLMEAGLTIYAPDPLEIVAITEKHVHRAQINTTGRPIKRGWLRISKYGS